MFQAEMRDFLSPSIISMSTTAFSICLTIAVRSFTFNNCASNSLKNKINRRKSKIYMIASPLRIFFRETGEKSVSLTAIFDFRYSKKPKGGKLIDVSRANKVTDDESRPRSSTLTEPKLNKSLDLATKKFLNAKVLFWKLLKI